MKTAIGFCIFLVLIIALLPRVVIATVSSCGASVNISNVTTSSTNNFTITVNNTSNVNIIWIKITRPSGDFTITNHAISGWQVSLTSSQITITPGTTPNISPSGQANFQFEVLAGSSQAGPADWIVETSDDSGGANATSCTGSLGTSIFNGPPSISDITSTNITGTSATISWTTDTVSNSTVEYGLTAAYGSSQSDSNLVTSRSINLSGLAVGTTYHFRVVSTNGGGTTNSSDSTFTTLSPPAISNIVVTSITNSSASVTWTTNIPANSVVNYGLTVSYGLNKSSGSLVTSHSLNLTGLNAETIYHYRVNSTNSTGTTTSADNTFTTAASPTVPIPDQPATNTTTTSTATTSVTTPGTPPPPRPVPIDNRPQVSLTLVENQVFKAVPTIEGQASDDKLVTKIEYSIDGGKNWIIVPIKASKSVKFSFTPPIFEDDNYEIRARATDSGGNTAVSVVYTIVFDTLVPRVGGLLFASGPVEISPIGNVVIGAVGVPQAITLSALGGPTKIEIRSSETSANLTRNLDSGLWQGELNFKDSGLFQIDAYMLDGAGNETTKNLGSIYIVPSGKVTFDGRVLSGGEVKVYYFEATLGRFFLWDAGSYGQKNPQVTDASGRYKLRLPGGKYYLEVTAPGYKRIRTNIFEIMDSMPINNNFEMSRASLVPFLNQKNVNIELARPRAPRGSDISNFVERPISEIIPVNLQGKRIVTFLSSWHPMASNQMRILDDLNSNSIVILVQESQAVSQIFKRRGRYNVDIMGDTNGEITKDMPISVLPMHFLVQDGIIKKVKLGLLTATDLLDN